jgi:CubicO group peptidase (beta-lactamase class C family)
VAVPEGQMETELDQILGEAVDRGDLIGAAMAVSTPRGAYAGAAGQRSEGAAMTPDTIVWIASMTKAVTAVAAMQLVEQGLVELDAPCGDLVPYLADVEVLDGFSDGGEPLLRPPKRPVTLRHLLTHTAGFGYDFTDARIARYVAEQGVPSTIDGSTASYEQPILFDPGDRWAYGINIDWAGQVIEAVTKTRLDEYLRSAIFDPLGLDDTGFRRDADRRDRTADMYLRTPDGLVQIPFELNEDPEFLMGGGGLYGTVVDYLRFLRMMLGGGELEGTRVVTAETVRTMAANHVGDLIVGGWQTANPVLSNDVDLGTGQQFGLSFLINSEPTPEGRAAGSLMWAGLANSYYWIDLTSKVTGVFTTQILPFFDGPALNTWRAVERTVYASQ